MEATQKTPKECVECIEPDLGFIQELQGSGKKCFQCGTCSAVCALSTGQSPYPAKQMAWAAWGMKAPLLKDPDVWLCHQCNDCSVRCPRSAGPSEVLARVRQMTVIHYSFPRFLGQWVSRPKYIPLLLGAPALLLGVMACLGFSSQKDEKIIFPFSSYFPHWALIGFFGIFSVLALAAALKGVFSFWGAMERASGAKKKGVFGSLGAALKTVLWRKNLSQCTESKWRLWAHLLAASGFVALLLVTFWVMALKINPLVQEGFVYPFEFWSPWKILANLGGLALLVGCVQMGWKRIKKGENDYFSWAFLSLLFLVVLTGFVIEVLHYLRMTPHRHMVYFIHLVLVFALIVYGPYSKFAHVVYRFLAMVFVEQRKEDKDES